MSGTEKPFRNMKLFHGGLVFKGFFLLLHVSNEHDVLDFLLCKPGSPIRKQPRSDKSL